MRDAVTIFTDNNGREPMIVDHGMDRLRRTPQNLGDLGNRIEVSGLNGRIRHQNTNLS
jgi:hypothetical protein